MVGDESAPLPDPPASGWYPVPDKPAYERFWNGQAWTSQRYWGVEGGVRPSAPQPAVHPPALPRYQPTAAWSPAVPIAPASFYAIVMMIVAPIFIGACAIIAIAAFTSTGGTVFGVVATAFGVVFSFVFVRRPYVAIIERDGGLVFKALVGRKETLVSHVTRIAIRSSGRGVSWAFYFDGTSALLDAFGGRGLARYLVALNPDIPHPVRRFGL